MKTLNQQFFCVKPDVLNILFSGLMNLTCWNIYVFYTMFAYPIKSILTRWISWSGIQMGNFYSGVN